MNVRYGSGPTEYGPGVSVDLTGEEVATAILAYLFARGVHVEGPRTVTVNGGLCRSGNVYVDPSGAVTIEGERWSGRGPTPIVGCPACGQPLRPYEPHRCFALGDPC